MTKIFIVNGAQAFAHSGAKFNSTILDWDKSFFTPENGFELQISDVTQPFDPEKEVEKFIWADVVIYHTPVWWFSLPHGFKTYLDVVFTAGHRKGLYYSDGRNSENPSINYGTGGNLHGRKYMLTTTWNAPETAFTLENEFFGQKSVDEGVMFGFHKMNAFVGMSGIDSFHFHDVQKNWSEEGMQNFRANYLEHLSRNFEPKLIEQL